MTSILVVFLICYYFFTLIISSYACPPSLDSLNLPPPVIHTECLTRNSCQRGYICQLNRCVGGRALASKTKNFQNEDSEMNLKMEQCCTDDNLPERCMSYCSLSSYNESSIFRLFSEPNRCPMSSLRTIHFCASQNMDHRKCCEENLIPSNCMDLCSVSHSKSYFDESKLHCLQYISIMKKCFEMEIEL